MGKSCYRAASVSRRVPIVLSDPVPAGDGVTLRRLSAHDPGEVSRCQGCGCAVEPDTAFCTDCRNAGVDPSGRTR